MRRLLFAALIAFASITIDGTANAQIAAAIGKPLTSPDMPPGTVSVRVVAGSPANQVEGTDVTLIVNGTPRVARTDSAGRAFFKDLPIGATVKASVLDEDKKEVPSEEFQLSADGGVRLLLSTKPFQAGAGAPFAGGAGGAMPEPRQMSGEPRAEQADSPGTVTVRLTYDDFKDPTPPAGVTVSLVGYDAKDNVELQQVKTDKDGRATFGNLDRTGATSYFAMAQLQRGSVIDRMISTPAVLDSRTGVRLVLSADKRSSTEPAVDDIIRIEKQDHAPAAGKVRVSLEGIPDLTQDVMLMAITQTPSADGSIANERRELGRAKPTRAAVDPSDLKAQSQFEPKPDMPVHVVHVQVHGGGGTNEPLAGAGIRLVPATTKDVAVMTAPIEVKTPEGGTLDLTDSSNKPIIAVININGKEMRSQPFDLTKTGGILDVEAQWDGQGKPEVEFDVQPDPNQVLFIESVMRKQIYRSIPFQAVDGRGTHATLYVYPRIMFSFSLTSHIDDAFLAVSGRFDVTNNAWAPYVGGPDGLVIPLPKNFKGAIVGEQDQGDVAVAQGEGYRIGRPIPPGGKQFHGAFSLGVDEGHVDWSLDLPLGAFQAGMEILQTPGMTVKTPPNVEGQTMTVPQGTFFVLPQISILPHQSMVMTINNLPSAPKWRTWAPRIVGIVAVLVMLSGLGFALSRSSLVRAADAARSKKRAALLDELVELEKSGKNDKRRTAVTAELEDLWDDPT